MVNSDERVQIALTLGSGSILVFTMFSEPFLKSFNLEWIPTSGLAIVMGLVLGGIVKISNNDTAISTQEFDSKLFTLLLLPVIIFEAAYHSSNYYVFLMLKPILLFSFAGTLLSFFVIWPCSLSFLPNAEAAMFAALISAVDPVATLSVFSAIKVEPKLEAFISGEAILNDAISIALYRAAKEFEGENAARSLGENIGLFILLLTSSVAIGLGVGLICAVAFKFGRLWQVHHVQSEIVIFIAFSYTSFLIAEMAGQSGIIASLIAGFTMKDFAKPNLTMKAQEQVTESLKVLAHASETFIFVQVGINTALYGFSEFNFGFIVLTILMCLVSRFFSTFSLSFLHNFFKKETSNTYLPRSFQVVSFWSGLRGAIAFAVAFDFPNDNNNRALIISTVCFVILFTVLMQGSTTRMVISKMGIQTGCEPESKKDLKSKEAQIQKSTFRLRLLGLSRWVKSYVHRPGAMTSGDDALQVRSLIGRADVVDSSDVAIDEEKSESGTSSIIGTDI